MYETADECCGLLLMSIQDWRITRHMNYGILRIEISYLKLF